MVSCIMNRSSCASGSGYVPSCSIGFCVASTKNGSGRRCVWPAAVTAYALCIAWSRAACVFGGARLISSARTTLPKIGPFANLKKRFPVAWSSSSSSVPVMSLGIRSGVNCTREKLRSSACATVCTSSVFASPGTPTSSTCPPARSAATRSSTILCWPMIRRPICSDQRQSARGAPIARAARRRVNRPSAAVALPLARLRGCVDETRS